MKSVPCATAITLSSDERVVLEGLSRSTKNHVRMRFRAGIVLLAVDGLATRAIGRTIRYTRGTGSQWRRRYARDRLAGLDETGERGAAPRYGPVNHKRVLAMLDQPPPSGYSNWTAPPLARTLADVHEQFLAYVDQGLLNGSSVYRIVSMGNQPDTVPAKIEVIQFGLKEAKLPPVRHETTTQSGLLHRDGTLSLARLAPGTGSSALFICIGDQPSLDLAGKRNPDAQGFAAFGQVIEGMDVVRHIFSRAEAKDAMEHPIPIIKAERV